MVKCQLIMTECSSRESPKENLRMKIGNRYTQFPRVVSSASESSALEEKLEILIEVSKTAAGCADLSSKNLLSVVLQLITQSLHYPSCHEYAVLFLKLLRNLCGGIVVSQVLAIVSLAGKEHLQAIWGGLFHHVFPMIAKVRRLPIVTEILLIASLETCPLHGLVDVVDTLLSPGLLELPFSLLHNLETPAIIRIVMKQADNLETTTTYTPEFCPCTGIRRDMVAVIDNCAHRRKLTEEGMYRMAIAESEFQGSVNVPELAGLSLGMEIDQKTHHAVLVNRFRFLDFEAVKETFAYASYLWLVQGLEDRTSQVIEQF
ncbi:hypothetical protein POTOM_046477 [Populus tomentosa]|uniref:Uncharacterized protein n=1 Tax=Populus tomentosa TaxID=118781 RepID=A0A8X7YEQ6_POPTO|nr:hypothetical protein POTOM_046477 [Populus tomentosa]